MKATITATVLGAAMLASCLMSPVPAQEAAACIGSVSNITDTVEKYREAGKVLSLRQYTGDRFKVAIEAIDAAAGKRPERLMDADSMIVLVEEGSDTAWFGLAKGNCLMFGTAVNAAFFTRTLSEALGKDA